MWGRWLMMAPLQMFFNILTYFVAFPLAALSVMLGVDKLPYPLNLFHTHDDNMDGGQHQKGWPKAKGLALIIQRAKWMMRNPAYGFAAFWFGFPHQGMKPTKSWHKGSAWDSGKTSIEYVKMEQGGEDYFSYRAQLCYSKTHYIKIWVGWHFDDKGTGYHMLKCMFHPYKATGK